MIISQEPSLASLDFQNPSKETSFENFIKITEMKRYRRLLEKRLMHQYAR